jgi:hypothetical protein
MAPVAALAAKDVVVVGMDGEPHDPLNKPDPINL